MGHSVSDEINRTIADEPAPTVGTTSLAARWTVLELAEEAACPPAFPGRADEAEVFLFACEFVVETFGFAPDGIWST
ncbi:hypothetical protein D9M69_646480 [compost metagenome]